MHRTNIYLSTAQQQALDVRARRQGTTRSALIRELLDAGLAEPEGSEPEMQAAMASLADAYVELVGSTFDDDPDLRIDR